MIWKVSEGSETSRGLLCYSVLVSHNLAQPRLQKRCLNSAMAMVRNHASRLSHAASLYGVIKNRAL